MKTGNIVIANDNYFSENGKPTLIKGMGYKILKSEFGEIMIKSESSDSHFFDIKEAEEIFKIKNNKPMTPTELHQRIEMKENQLQEYRDKLKASKLERNIKIYTACVENTIKEIEELKLKRRML